MNFYKTKPILAIDSASLYATGVLKPYLKPYLMGFKEIVHYIDRGYDRYVDLAVARTNFASDVQGDVQRRHCVKTCAIICKYKVEVYIYK